MITRTIHRSGSGHGDINGTSFWHLPNAMVRTNGILTGMKGRSQFIETRSEWIAEQDGEKKLLAKDKTQYSFGGDDTKRWIDFDCTMTAAVDHLKFGDTKEGTFALRSHPQLRIDNDPRRGVTNANGKAINSEGVKGKAIWGKNAKWVSYWGKVDGKSVGFAIMDHPENLRHPTTWHARAYGLGCRQSIWVCMISRASPRDRVITRSRKASQFDSDTGFCCIPVSFQRKWSKPISNSTARKNSFLEKIGILING